jgi:predicted nucleotidyltransferase component of viral defense system
VAGRVYNDLRNLARRRGRPTDELFELYLLERVLYRLSASTHRDRLVVKGGMVLAAYQLRRQTRDIDLQSRAGGDDEATVAELIRQVCEIEVDHGLEFDLARLVTSRIRQGDRYEGVRVRVPVALAGARLVFRIDVSFGDPITPAPVTLVYPSLLTEPFDILGYSLASVLAEKLVTMLEFADANTRDRDIGDVVAGSAGRCSGEALGRRGRIPADRRCRSMASGHIPRRTRPNVGWCLFRASSQLFMSPLMTCQRAPSRRAGIRGTPHTSQWTDPEAAASKPAHSRPQARTVMRGIRRLAARAYSRLSRATPGRCPSGEKRRAAIWIARITASRRERAHSGRGGHPGSAAWR